MGAELRQFFGMWVGGGDGGCSIKSICAINSNMTLIYIYIYSIYIYIISVTILAQAVLAQAMLAHAILDQANK